MILDLGVMEFVVFDSDRKYEIQKIFDFLLHVNGEHALCACYLPTWGNIRFAYIVELVNNTDFDFDSSDYEVLLYNDGKLLNILR